MDLTCVRFRVNEEKKERKKWTKRLGGHEARSAADVRLLPRYAYQHTLPSIKLSRHPPFQPPSQPPSLLLPQLLDR